MRTWTILLALILCCSCGREPTAQPDARLDPQKQRTRDFWTAYREANQLRSRGDFEAAVPAYRRALDVGGHYQYRKEGEYHLFNPESVHKLQYVLVIVRKQHEQ